MKRKQGSYTVIGSGQHFEIYIAGRYARNKRGNIRVFSSLRNARNAASAIIRASKVTA